MSESVLSDALRWSHATNSLGKLVEALEDPEISAIECDILMGSLNDDATKSVIPILSHPPHRDSDLSVSKFLNDLAPVGPDGTRVLDKHIKLDFKEIEALLPTLNQISDLNIKNTLEKTIFLNADILPGPGERSEQHVSATTFLETCLKHVQQGDTEKELKYSLSLGYKADYRSEDGYTEDDIENMSELVRQFNLTGTNPGLVLALNARVLATKPSAFDTFLKSLTNSSILAWTGAGEPAIPQSQIDKITEHFESIAYIDRIGFDCEVDESG